MPKKKLSDHGYNIYSQFGEDGIIAKIFEIIGTESKVCVEFGAWDGFYLSNTANLWARQQWKAILIESDPERFKVLRSHARHNCHCLQAKVSAKGENNLENILQRAGITGGIDLLSIDIDGDDYYIFQSLTTLRPRLVICEHNPTIPPHLEVVPSPGNYFGCSALSLVKLAETKGYRLVAATETNSFFVNEKDFGRFDGFATTLGEIVDTRRLTYVLTGYAGDFVLSGEPAYGYNQVSAQTFFQGEGFYYPKLSPHGKRAWRPWHLLRGAERGLRRMRKKISARFRPQNEGG